MRGVGGHVQAQGRYIRQVGATRLLVHGTRIQLQVADPVSGIDGVQVHDREGDGEDLGGGFRQPAPLPVPAGPVEVQPVHVDPLEGRLGHLVPGHLGDAVLEDDGVECPALVGPRHLLSHGSQEPLGVKEPCHPEDGGASSEYPSVELGVPLQKLREPKPESGGLP